VRRPFLDRSGDIPVDRRKERKKRGEGEGGGGWPVHINVLIIADTKQEKGTKGKRPPNVVKLPPTSLAHERYTRRGEKRKRGGPAHHQKTPSSPDRLLLACTGERKKKEKGKGR